MALWVVYLGFVAWTVGYDTIYAHQDKMDDARLGLRSTALYWGDRTGRYVALMYMGVMIAWMLGGLLISVREVYWMAMGFIFCHFLYQVFTLDLDDPKKCLRLFQQNVNVGWALFLGILFDSILRLP
jgi:4-hydroxybenzoate polyprenyltransferase